MANFIGLLMFVLIGYFLVKAAKSRLKKQEFLRKKYEESLMSNDKRGALEDGRRYYASLRGGRLKSFDEQAIMNDINTMDRATSTGIDNITAHRLKEKALLLLEAFNDKDEMTEHQLMVYIIKNIPFDANNPPLKVLSFLIENGFVIKVNGIYKLRKNN
jgi:hypothetical protein